MSHLNEEDLNEVAGTELAYDIENAEEMVMECSGGGMEDDAEYWMRVLEYLYGCVETCATLWNCWVLLVEGAHHKNACQRRTKAS